jgi:ABC-type sugar transport system ATPase subunit
MLKLNHISKRVGDFVLRDISFNVNDGEYFVLLGMSGAGKSVLLESIAGLLVPNSGTIILNGIDITNEKIQKRNIGLVFQQSSVFPHLTVFSNIAYPLKNKNLTKKQVEIRVHELAEMTAVTKFLERKPKGLSGGEMQRVALARALALEPKLLLLDEPLSSLDALLRSELRTLLRKINSLGQTIIHVTHDYNEAISLASRVGIIENGELQQIGTPEDVFLNPQSEFVARFVGVSNFFEVSSVSHSSNKVQVLNSQFECVVSKIIDNTKYMSIAPEDVVIFSRKPDDSDCNIFQAEIEEIIPGININCLVLHGELRLEAIVGKNKIFAQKTVWVQLPPASIRLIPQYNNGI